MPFRRRTLPSFTFSNSSSRDSFSLPDYYRSTRLEQYGPYYRSSEPVRDLMKTIHLRGRESSDSICALPDIFEDDEFELDDMAFGAGVKLDHADEKSTRDGVEDADKHEQRERKLAWLWRLILSVLRRCHGRRIFPKKSAGRSIHIDLSE